MSRKYDFVMFGATGYTGRMMVEYLAKKDLSGVKWAVAGRSAEKLTAVLSRAEAKGADVIIANTDDKKRVDEVVASTKVILSAAGPFARHGETLVAACAATGTHWIDITGETIWVREMLDKYGEAAKRSGAVIISMCGFDSVPSDIGALYTVDRIEKEFGEKTRSVRAYFEFQGGMSGGTVDSLMGLLADYPKFAVAEMLNPYYLNPGRRRLPPAHGTEQTAGDSTSLMRAEDKDVMLLSRNRHLNSWTWPFIMSVINTRVVRRSAALAEAAGKSYGRDFSYNEYARSTSLFTALVQYLMLLVALMIAVIPPLRWAVRKLLLPKPGQGPSEKMRAKSWYRVTFVGTSESGRVLRTTFSGVEAYEETARLVCEATLLLAKERDSLPCAKQAGFMTPAFALGMPYARRLEEAGVKLAWAEE